MFGQDMTQDQLSGLYNANVVDETGDKIGGVGQVYLDDQSDRPTWVTVKTGFFGTKETFIPLDHASMTGNDIKVPYAKSYVKDAPNIDADHHITPEEEAELYRYYNIGYAGGDVDRDRAYVDTDRDRVDVDTDRDRVDVDRDRVDVDRDDSVVRHEEELRVGKECVETGRVRLRKHVVTEQKTVTVPVQREEVRLESEPLQPGDVAAGRIGEDEVVVTLSEERPVVEKDVVAKERVGLGKEVHTEERSVTENVAKEQVEIDRDGTAGRDTVVDRDRDDRI